MLTTCIVALWFAFVTSSAMVVSATECDCTNVENRVCVNGPAGSKNDKEFYQAYSVEFLGSFLDTTEGYREFVYEVCHNTPDAEFCPAEPEWKALSHLDMAISDITSCSGDNVKITVRSDPAGWCEIETGDPSCDVTDFRVVKCTPVGEFSAGKCFKFTLEVAGERAKPAASGAIFTYSKAGDDVCPSACLVGPSCKSCEPTPPPPPATKEFTRSPGFWSTHPKQVKAYLPQIGTVCGKTFTHFSADPPETTSVTQALCISAKPKPSTSAYNLDILLRQLLAAKLNEAVTEKHGGSLSQAHDDLIDHCNGVCALGSTDASEVLDCANKLDEFNNELDTLEPTPPLFADPGRAYPGECQQAREDGFLFFK